MGFAGAVAQWVILAVNDQSQGRGCFTTVVSLNQMWRTLSAPAFFAALRWADERQ